MRRVILDQVAWYHSMFDVEMFLRKLLEDQGNTKLTHLTLYNFCFDENSEDLSPTDLADALCSVENVKLSGYIPFVGQTMERIINNILLRPTKIKTLIIELDKENCDFYYSFEELIHPLDLRTLLNKMTTLYLEGSFSPEQLDALRSLPDVQTAQIQYPCYDEFCYSVKKG